MEEPTGVGRNGASIGGLHGGARDAQEPPGTETPRFGNRVHAEIAMDFDWHAPCFDSKVLFASSRTCVENLCVTEIGGTVPTEISSGLTGEEERSWTK